MTPLSCSLCITKFNERAPPIVAPTLPPTGPSTSPARTTLNVVILIPQRTGEYPSGVQPCVSPPSRLVTAGYFLSTPTRVARPWRSPHPNSSAGMMPEAYLPLIFGTTASKVVVPSCGHKAGKDNLPFLPSQSTWSAGRAQPRSQQRLSTFLVLCPPQAQVQQRLSSSSSSS